MRRIWSAMIRVRRTAEVEAGRELGRARGQLADAERLAKMVGQARAERLIDTPLAPPALARVHTLVEHEQAAMRLRVEIRQTVERATKRALERWRERRVAQTLAERQARRERQACERRAQAVLDDLANLRALLEARDAD